MERRTAADAPSAAHRRVRRRDAAATSLLWAAAVFTIAVLLCIIGYILLRGLVSDNVRTYPVVARGASTFAAGDGGALTVLVHRDLRLKDLTLEELRAILAGETANWGLLTGQDIDIVVAGLRPDGRDPAVSAALLPAGAAYVPAVLWKDRPEEVVAAVASARGAVGFLRAAALPARLDRRVRTVPVRSLSVVVDPAVVALKDGRRLAAIGEAGLRDLFAGRVRNWKDLGGPDLPVVLFHPGATGGDFQGFRGLVLGETVPAGDVRGTDGVEALLRLVAATPGAAGIVPFAAAASLETPPILPVERREIRRNLTLAFFVEEPKRAGRVGGVSTIIGNTVLMILLTLLLATPIGVGAAVYLTEYARQGVLVGILRFGTETLAGIPSIIFGLFGYIVFVGFFHWGIGLLSGTLTITLMILPTIVRTAEEAIKSVPASYREGSLALGATRWQTVTRVVLRAASPGILTGVILGIGRAVGETAALILTMGSDYRSIQGLMSSARVLAIHLYILVKEGISFDKAFATAMILIVVILVVNFTATSLIGRMSLMQNTGGNRNGKRR